MAIKIEYSSRYRNNICFTDYFQKQDRSVLLLTHYREEHPYLEKVNSVLLEKFINLDLQSISWEEISERLKRFFVDLNWEIAALFHKVADLEKGVSLLLVIIENDKLYYVSLGRFLTAVLSKESANDFHEDWKNFHVKSPEKLGLLGGLQQDIHVKPGLVSLKNNQQFISCSLDVVNELDLSSLNIYNSGSTFKDLFKHKPFSYCIVDYTPPVRKKKRSWLITKRFRITIIAMFLMIIFSAYYFFLGKNTVEDRLHITREQFQLTVRNIDLLKIQEMLPLDYGLIFVPQDNVELFVEWESTLPFDVTLPPHYDMTQLFLASQNELYSYNKRDKKNDWKTVFPQPLNSINILDANLMVVTTTDHHSYCLKRDTGDVVWDRKGVWEKGVSEKNTYRPVQISLEVDRRLNNSIVLFPDKTSLTLVNILSGDTLYYYESDASISFVSDFDFIDKAVYVVKDNSLYKIRIDLKL